jgi:hypothetical protein
MQRLTRPTPTSYAPRLANPAADPYKAKQQQQSQLKAKLQMRGKLHLQTGPTLKMKTVRAGPLHSQRDIQAFFALSQQVVQEAVTFAGCHHQRGWAELLHVIPWPIEEGDCVLERRCIAPLFGRDDATQVVERDVGGLAEE